jgi:ketosteroid isomerase-like protein
VEQMSDLERINQYNEAFQRAMQMGDADACIALCAENAILMPPEEPPVKGRAAIRNHFSGLGADASVQGNVVELSISGELAYQHSRVSWRGDEGSRYTDSLDVLQKQDDGSWLLLASAWNTSSGFLK